ncbi:unnamed protein product, partial [Rotaria magnacalcarata]
WKCRSEMPKEYEFGKLSVLCAGFGYSNDSYNLNGFCRLEYHLELKDTQSSDSSTSDDHLDAPGIPTSVTGYGGATRR